MQYGLLGETLSHSFSPRIHARLGTYEYVLRSLPPEKLDDFLKKKDFRGLNVTIPYKKAVLPYCDELSQTAREIGSVNTLVHRPDGSLLGDNTDLYGFLYMANRTGIKLSGKKVLILGSGGTSLTAQVAARQEHAREIVVVSRKGPVTYEMLDDHRDAECIINTTPVGMFPHTGKKLIDPADFHACQGILDVVYNPLRTALLLSAREKGIPYAGGLSMLVAQAKRSSELFPGLPIQEQKIEEILAELLLSLTNIVLIGMPGCGKTALGKRLADRLGREHIDVDTRVLQKTGLSADAMIRQQGEPAFRRLETQIITEIGKQTGKVISTGGGSILAEDNYAPLAQNGILFFLERDLNRLPTEGRPLSAGGRETLRRLYQTRLPLYRRFADFRIDNNVSAKQATDAILEVFHEAARN